MLVDDYEELYHPTNGTLSHHYIYIYHYHYIVDARNGSIHWEIYCGNPHSLFIGDI